MSREIVQLEDLLTWAEKALGADHEDVVMAKVVKEEANKVVQVRVS